MSTITRRGFVARLDDVSSKERTVTAVITTDAVDSYKEVVVPKGIDLKRYRKNPVVLWNHNLDPAVPKVPIGKNLWIKPGSSNRSLVARTQFADDEAGHRFFALYESEVLRAWSIGANEDLSKCGAPVEKELRDRPEWAKCRRVIRACELVEYSAVPIGANPEALTTAVERGLWLPETVRELAPPPADDDDQADDSPPAPELPPFVGRSFAEVHAATVATIRQAAGRIAADEADRLRGRV
jgi:hypothetical protein